LAKFFNLLLVSGTAAAELSRPTDLFSSVLSYLFFLLCRCFRYWCEILVFLALIYAINAYWWFQGNGDGRGTYEEETIAHAKQILKPFFLRRLKSEVW